MELSLSVLFWQSLPFPADVGPSERNWTPPGGLHHPAPSSALALHPCGGTTHHTLPRRGAVSVLRWGWGEWGNIGWRLKLRNTQT